MLVLYCITSAVIYRLQKQVLWINPLNSYILLCHVLPCIPLHRNVGSANFH